MQQFGIVVQIKKLLPEAATDISSNVLPALGRKSKGKTSDLTDPGTLYSLARAISNTIIFALLKKVGGVSSSMSAKALNAVALIASGCLTSSHTASKNDLRACLEKFLNALS